MRYSFRFADKISVGDEVLVEGYDDFKPVKVVNVTMFVMPGNYLSSCEIYLLEWLELQQTVRFG